MHQIFYSPNLLSLWSNTSAHTDTMQWIYTNGWQGHMAAFRLISISITWDLISTLKESVPVRATRRGRHRRLARTISSRGSRSGLGVSSPQYRYSSTARIHATSVLGIATWGEEDRQRGRERGRERDKVRERESEEEMKTEGKTQRQWAWNKEGKRESERERKRHANINERVVYKTDHVKH